MCSFPGCALTSILTVILHGRSHDDTHPEEEETGFIEAVLGAPEPFLTGAAALDWFLCVQASRGGPQASTPAHTPLMFRPSLIAPSHFPSHFKLQLCGSFDSLPQMPGALPAPLPTTYPSGCSSGPSEGTSLSPA